MSSQSAATIVANLLGLIDSLVPEQAALYQAVLHNLAKRAPGGFEAYCQHLYTRRHDAGSFHDFLAEARVALLFQQHGFEVEMQDRPDLRLSLTGQVIYIEVKRFREKEQDRLDDIDMADYDDAGLLVPTGDTTPMEGRAAWEQVVDVIGRKLSQLIPNAINIIVVVSDSSHAIDDAILSSVMNEVDDRVTVDKEYTKVNGVLLISNDWNISQGRKIYFTKATRSSVPLGDALAGALSDIRSE